MTDAVITLAVLLWITTIGPLTLIYLPRHIRAVHHGRRRRPGRVTLPPTGAPKSLHSKEIQR